MLAFISYARKDQDFAKKLARDLRERGVNVWLDVWDIPPGTRWDTAIDEAIRKASHFLIILSPDSVESREVLSELSFALHEGKFIVPILYQPCEIPRNLRILQYQYIDFTQDYEQTLTRLVEALQEISERV